MPKNIYSARYALILRRLEQSPATYQEIADFLDIESEIHERTFSASQRTLQRDIKDIASQLNIEILNNRSTKKYYIASEDGISESSRRLLDAYQINSFIQSASFFSNKVFLEKRASHGLEYFHPLLTAINKKRIINFMYYEYWSELETQKKIHPLALMEAQGRWYLIGINPPKKELERFGLDRISELNIQDQKFREKYSIDIQKYFESCFGLLQSETKLIEKVELKFNYEQGLYVDNYPLHHSQTEIAREVGYIIFSFELQISYDFLQALLAFGSELEVLKPASLRKEMKNMLENTLRNYKK
ncbi:MAG: WYL domain-containing protein [Chitinophagaceae bacterium]|nr:WYL domain-containing protein [Chitinophagaceae bacterium]